MSRSSGMLAVKQEISDEISKHVEDFLAKGGKVTEIEGGKDDTNHKPARECFNVL